MNAQNTPRLVRVFVALADNAHQGIIPVPKALGNGDDPGRNLYWGAAFGVRTFFQRSGDWKLVTTIAKPNEFVLERLVFQHTASGSFLIADAYRGSQIKQAIQDFYRSAAGTASPPVEIANPPDGGRIALPDKAQLSVYVGHDGLMDFSLEETSKGDAAAGREAIVLACASKAYFARGLRATGAAPLLWTTNLMAPEAYTLKAALDGWAAGETSAQIRKRAAAAYAKYQKCSVGAAEKLLVTGW